MKIADAIVKAMSQDIMEDIYENEQNDCLHVYRTGKRNSKGGLDTTCKACGLFIPEGDIEQWRNAK